MGTRSAFAPSVARRCLLAAATAATVLTPVLAAGSARATGTVLEAPSGWFLQLSSLAPSYSPTAVVGWVRAACSAAPGRATLVLQDVADDSGQLATRYLDPIAAYLPGGAHHCIAHLYVGTLEPAWSGAGSLYVQGISNATFRRTFIAQSAAIARQFVHRYPYLRFGWYVTMEANLNELYYPAIRSAYAALLDQLQATLASVRQVSGYLWSPAFWYPYSSYHSNVLGMTGLTHQLALLFSALRAETRIPSIDLQDFVAASACQPVGNRMTAQDAASWVRYLASVPGAPPVTLNVEWYQLNCTNGGVSPPDPAALAQRLAVYTAARTPLGPAFELRYWALQHT